MPLQLMSGFSAKAGAGIRKLFKEAKALYAPEGEFMAGTEAAIARGGKRSVASGVQQLASAGLAGTSIVGGLGKKYEEEVGMPARERATSARLGALAGLLQAEAGAELQMAPRYGYQAPTPSYGGGGSRRTTAPRPTAQPRATTRPQPLPTLNLPDYKAPQREPTGYQGVFYGADYYKRQQQPTSAPVSPKPLSSYYSSSLYGQPGGPAGPPLSSFAG